MDFASVGHSLLNCRAVYLCLRRQVRDIETVGNISANYWRPDTVFISELSNFGTFIYIRKMTLIKLQVLAMLHCCT